MNTAIKQQKLTILLVEDNKVDRKLMTGLLTEAQNAYDLMFVDTLSEAKEALEQENIDVVLLDLNLEDSHGQTTITELTTKFPLVAVVITTGAFEDDMGVKTLSLGVQDFLVKGKFSGYTLNKAIKYALERKRLEIELKETHQRLQSMQNQLIQAEKLKVVGGLASGVAHEVKNPLATIIYGITYLATELKEKTGNIAFVIENIQDASNRASHIITDLLDFASMNNVELVDSNVCELLEQSLKLTHHEYHKRQITITKNYSDNLPNISIDPNRIEQVIVNLLLNAYYAIGAEGEVVITTRLVSREEALAEINFVLNENDNAKSYVLVLCDDSGSGIPDEKIIELFDPFFTTRRSDGGVGLGLSVSKAIVDMHKAYITLENRQGTGARAAILFPVK